MPTPAASTHPRATQPAPRTIGVVTVGRPTFDLELGVADARAAREVLAGSRHVVSVGPEVVTDLDVLDAAVADLRSARPDVVVVLGATFVDGRFDEVLAERLGLPILHWSFPEPRTGGRLRLNSFCGAQLAAHTLRRRGHRSTFVHVDPDDDAAAATVDAALTQLELASDEDPGDDTPDLPDPPAASTDPDVVRRADEVVEALRQRRIRVFGEPPDGFEPCAYRPDELRSATGIASERVPIEHLLDRARSVPVEVATHRRDAMSASVPLDVGLAPEQLEPSARLLAALEDEVAEHASSAVATRCWPECLADFGGAVCAPHGALADQGVPAACEADLYGAASLLLLQEVSGAVPVLADVVDLHDDGTSVLWHCGVAAPSLADPDRPARITTHPNRGVPMVFDFALRPGRITVARLGRTRHGDVVLVGTGELVDRPAPFVGTAGVIRWDAPADVVRDLLFGHGVEHHLALVHGDHRAVVVEVARRWGLPSLDLTPSPATGGERGADGPAPAGDRS